MPNTASALHRLLDTGLASSSTYDGHLSNHLPMAQQALIELGATADRLQAWTARYALRLAPAAVQPPVRPMAPADYGQPETDPAWRAHFAARIAAVGRDASLRESLPWLLRAPGAGLFHGLIRTAHAVLAAHDGELAGGLAHWAAFHRPLLQAASVAGPSLAWGEWLAALQHLPHPAARAGRSLVATMHDCAATAGLGSLSGRLALEDGTLRELALLAAQAYAGSGNFLVLHLVTASHAMAVLQPWWPEPMLPRGFVSAFAAGLLASATLPQVQAGAPARHPWPPLVEAACAQDDEHAIKLTHAAWRLDRRWPDPVWRSAAERALGLAA